MSCFRSKSGGAGRRRSSGNSRGSPTNGPSKSRYCYSIFLTCLCIALIVLLSLLLTIYIFYMEANPAAGAHDPDLVCQDEPDEVSTEGPLILTPYIENGRIEEGQALARVRNLKGVQSFSGYLTVNQTYNANLFFWFFPALSAPPSPARTGPGKSNTSLVLYLQGGPGLSSLFGLFLENGPFYIDENKALQRREHSWGNTHHILYVDSPIGTGFSFADNNETYAKVQSDVSRDLYVALVQFFQLFPAYRAQDFYITGTSYSGKYIPTIAYKIHVENQRSTGNRINLKGVAIGSGYFEGRIQDEYSDFYYHLGLLDSQQRDEFRTEELKIKELVKNMEYSKAREALSPLILSKLNKYTGFDDIYMYNALEPHTPPTALHFEAFLNRTCVRDLVHVGPRPYVFLAVDVYSKFADSDFYTSTRAELEKLLNSDYRVLLYSSQFDLIVTHVGVSKFIETLAWHGQAEFRSATREVWRVNRTIAGYVKRWDNLVHVLIRNTGHMACFDKAEYCEDMITKFTSGAAFGT